MAFGMYESPFYCCDKIPGNNLTEKRSAVIPSCRSFSPWSLTLFLLASGVLHDGEEPVLGQSCSPVHEEAENLLL